ncbi:unnamed protein product [Arctogadus glacialis]
MVQLEQRCVRQGAGIQLQEYRFGVQQMSLVLSSFPSLPCAPLQQNQYLRTICNPLLPAWQWPDAAASRHPTPDSDWRKGWMERKTERLPELCWGQGYLAGRGESTTSAGIRPLLGQTSSGSDLCWDQTSSGSDLCWDQTSAGSDLVWVRPLLGSDLVWVRPRLGQTSAGFGPLLGSDLVWVRPLLGSDLCWGQTSFGVRGDEQRK